MSTSLHETFPPNCPSNLYDMLNNCWCYSGWCDSSEVSSSCGIHTWPSGPQACPDHYCADVRPSIYSNAPSVTHPIGLGVAM
ncbi:hypothetical protein E2C01_073839 [Portunus trituberculatus]|uniref:Uncharacterized protein n=1 Tax=Portunus trituberculatus TaxID=210409 RepID=A0A5B7ICQ6_PORTR|nr:hypothetical protein [Portunus trituberculatus]